MVRVRESWIWLRGRHLTDVGLLGLDILAMFQLFIVMIDTSTPNRMEINFIYLINLLYL